MIDRIIDPPWLVEARRWIGTAEIPGAATNSAIAQWLQKLRAWWADDETPWCGTFVAWCMDSAGYAIPKYWMRARAWGEYAVPIDAPAHGCIVIFERAGGGHVGFVVGEDEAGNLLVLGGNQGNKVSIARFPKARVVDYRWPVTAAWFPRRAVVIADADSEISRSEA